MANARRLAELSMVPPLAAEVAAQIDEAAENVPAGVATEAYVDARLSAAQRTAIDALVPATATAEDIVNALQAV